MCVCACTRVDPLGVPSNVTPRFAAATAFKFYARNILVRQGADPGPRSGLQTRTPPKPAVESLQVQVGMQPYRPDAAHTASCSESRFCVAADCTALGGPGTALAGTGRGLLRSSRHARVGKSGRQRRETTLCQLCGQCCVCVRAPATVSGLCLMSRFVFFGGVCACVLARVLTV